MSVNIQKLVCNRKTRGLQYILIERNAKFRLISYPMFQICAPSDLPIAYMSNHLVN